MSQNDVIIIGAGPAGLSLANSLSSSGFSCIIIEKQEERKISHPSYDGRDIALTHFSQQLLKEMGVWDRFPETAVGTIREAKVLDGSSPYSMHFDCQKRTEDKLGYIISNHEIRSAVYQEAQTRDNIKLFSGVCVENIQVSHSDAVVDVSDGSSVSAKLVVAADSRFSSSRRHMGISTPMVDFGKVAIVCKATHDRPHHDIAYECFLYGGTLAVLPLNGQESSIVITVSPEKAASLMQMDDALFSADITQQFDHRFGKMDVSSQRFSYPLVATYADQFVTDRFALIGDAAVGMHPVTAHGYNLGLKGQHILTKVLKKAQMRGDDIGKTSVLSEYETKHRLASKPIYLGTNFLVRLYTDERKVGKFARKILLRIGNNFRPAKQAIIDQLTHTHSSGV